MLVRRAQSRIDQAAPKEVGKRVRREGEGGLFISCAPGTRALRRASFDGRTQTNMGVSCQEGKANKLGRIK